MIFDPTDIVAVLRRHGVHFVLIGGVAAALHGYDGAAATTGASVLRR